MHGWSEPSKAGLGRSAKGLRRAEGRRMGWGEGRGKRPSPGRGLAPVSGQILSTGCGQSVLYKALGFVPVILPSIPIEIAVALPGVRGQTPPYSELLHSHLLTVTCFSICWPSTNASRLIEPSHQHHDGLLCCDMLHGKFVTMHTLSLPALAWLALCQ